MDSNNKSIEQGQKIESTNSKDYIHNLKSTFILKKILEHLKKKITLAIIKINKDIQNRLNISINNYIQYSELFTPIEIEITPVENTKGNFINFSDEDKEYFHIYFDDAKEEIKRNSLSEEDKIKKIKIIIDHEIKSFKKLFYYCKCIKSINFTKFHRNI